MSIQFRSEQTVAPRQPELSWLRRRDYEFHMLEDELNELSTSLLRKFPTTKIFSYDYFASIHGETASQPEIRNTTTFGERFTDVGGDRRGYIAAVRVPWPEDLASRDQDLLVGGPRSLDSYSRSHVRQRGRALTVSWTGAKNFIRSEFEIPPHLTRQNCGCKISTIWSKVTVQALFDRDDAEVVAFLRAIEEILISLTSDEYASYDPVTGSIINSRRRSAKERRSAGFARYAALHDRTYFGFCSKQGKPAEVMGVTPELRVAIRAEAGLST